jgi:hypothetical protein
VDFHVQGQFEQLGVIAEQWAVLAEPLSEGSNVVVNAARSLSEGLKVEPVALNGSAEFLSEAPGRAGGGASP